MKEARHCKQVLQILNKITASMESDGDSQDEQFKILRQGMAYCWSVAVAALPEEGKLLMQNWFTSRNADIRWMMKENLKKNRLVRMDARWVETWQAK